jgi:lipopolysaccharide cholinephosphotransferase
MKIMTLQEVQNVSLDILKDVHSFCELHNIRYSLAYGTLIGAIRHKGFIPWDDDVDIIIPRPDFERFCQEFESSKGYKLYRPEDSENFMVFARVCDNERTLVKTNRPWSTEQTGIWIDIFPFEGLPNDENEFQSLVKEIRGIATKVYRLRFGKYLKLSETRGVKDFFFCLAKKIVYSHYDIRSLMQEHIKLMSSLKYEEQNFCGQLCVMDYPEKEHNPKQDFDKFVKIPFCDAEFYVMSGYDNVLHRYYGNYMELPPEEKRVPPQSFTQEYYWK